MVCCFASASSSLISANVASTLSCVLAKASGSGFRGGGTGCLIGSGLMSRDARGSSALSGTGIGESSANLSGLGLLSSSDYEKLEFKGLPTSCASVGPSLALLLPV